MEGKILFDMVEEFIGICDDLLLKGEMTEQLYLECTKKKKEFLEKMKSELV